MAKKQKKIYKEFMEACFFGNLEQANALISQGADVNYIDERKMESPLHYASRNGYVNIVEMLISKGANVNCKDNNGRSPLHWASMLDRLEVVDMLIKNGARVNDKDTGGNSPLHLASMTDNLEVVGMLIKNGAIVNDKNDDGNTPLYWAANWGELEVVKLLLSKGATIDKETIDVAKDKGHTKIVEILEDWPRTMATVALKEVQVYNHLPDMSYLTDLNELMGKKGKHYGGKKRRTIKGKSNKRRRTNRRRNSRKSRK